MDDQHLTCNFQNCGKVLTDVAWITICSHIFCEEDGNREFSKSLVCPACKFELRDKFDVFRQNLNPDEKTKSLLLIGLTPTTTMEIANRAVSFWIYQVKKNLTLCHLQYQQMLVQTQQHISHQQEVISKLNDKLAKHERSTDQTSLKYKAENDILKAEIQALKVDHEEHKFRLSDLNEKLTEKTHQLQKTKSLIDDLRRQQINPTFNANLRRQVLGKHEQPNSKDDAVFPFVKKSGLNSSYENPGKSRSEETDDVAAVLFPF